MSKATNYLISTQNADGGWGTGPGEFSEVYFTAFALHALSTQIQTTPIITAMAQEAAFLAGHKDPDGGFGSNGSSRVWETALSLLALARHTADLAVMAPAMTYVLDQQQADGTLS